MVGRHAVAQRVRAARILADVAADRARLLARRIGYVRQPEGGGRLAQAHIDHPGLDDGAHVVDVDLQDAVHARQADEHAAMRRDRAARQTRARAAGRVRHPEPIARPNHQADLLGGQRKDDGERSMLVDRPVVLVEHQVVVAPQHLLSRQQLAQRIDHARRFSDDGHAPSVRALSRPSPLLARAESPMPRAWPLAASGRPRADRRHPRSLWSPRLRQRPQRSPGAHCQQ